MGTHNGFDFLKYSRTAALAFIAAMICFAPNSWGQSAAIDEWKQVQEAMGRPGQMQAGDVIRFGMPRKDLHVVLDGVEIKPGLALGSWVAFKRYGAEAMVMGDLVLTSGEVPPAMKKLQEGGIQIAALHNHLLGEDPHVMYMHVASHGDAVQMAKAIREALALTKTPARTHLPRRKAAATWDSTRSKWNSHSGIPGK
jgi:hypothetical protein